MTGPPGERRKRVAHISESDYLQSRRHQCAGPRSELLLIETQRLYEDLGATHWQVIRDVKGTVLRPVIVDR